MPLTKRSASAASSASTDAKRAKTDGWEDVWGGMTPSSKKAAPPLCVLHTEDTSKGHDAVVGLDVDWTVIRTKSGKKFPTNASDWEFWHPKVPTKLRELRDEGKKVVFFTNQAGVEKGKQSLSELQTKFENINRKLGFAVPVLICTGNNQFRKPSIVLWEHFVKHMNAGVEPDPVKSMFIGDAAGRAKNWAPGKPKDFSASDRMFAANIGLPFATPERFFFGQREAPFEWNAFDAQGFLKQSVDAPPTKWRRDGQEMVLLVGPPASGKSTLSEREFIAHGYAHVNRDTLGTPARCLKAAGEALSAGKSVVVDNTNPNPTARADYVKLAKSKGVPVRCLWLKTPRDLAHHLNLVRQIITDGKRRRVPDVGFNSFYKNFKQPEAGEGFDEVSEVDFVPTFDDDNHKRIFSHWHA